MEIISIDSYAQEHHGPGVELINCDVSSVLLILDAYRLIFTPDTED